MDGSGGGPLEHIDHRVESDLKRYRVQVEERWGELHPVPVIPNVDKSLETVPEPPPDQPDGTSHEGGPTASPDQPYRVGQRGHPQQGYVKLSVDQSPGHPPQKHKVFWVDCPAPSETDLAVEKVVTGDAAPPMETLFEFTLTCDGHTEVIKLGAGDTWNWSTNVETELTERSTCSIDETDDRDATTVTVLFNDIEVDQGAPTT